MSFNTLISFGWPLHLLPKASPADPQRAVDLETVRVAARARHAREASNAKKQSRDYPLLPYECSHAFELEFNRTWISPSTSRFR